MWWTFVRTGETIGANTREEAVRFFWERIADSDLSREEVDLLVLPEGEALTLALTGGHVGAA